MWSILNNLTGRSRHSPRHCPVSADAIATQLVRNRKYEAVDRKSSRLVSQKVSDLWAATTPDAVNISDNFLQREFAADLQHLKLGKTLRIATLSGASAGASEWSTVKMLPGSVLLCPEPVPGLLGWAYPKQLGLSSTACGLVLGDSIRPCTNVVSLLHRIASAAPLSKPQTMY